MRRIQRCWLVVFGWMVFGAAGAWGWTSGSQQRIAEEAARLAPPDLFRQLVRHREVYLQGVMAPFQDEVAEHHMQNPDGSGRLDAVIRSMVETAIEAIRAPRPFHEVVYRLGIVSHYVADANNPLNTSQEDRQEQRYYGDFLRYLESTHSRADVVFYGFRSREQGGLDGLLQETFLRGRGFYPLVGREYERIQYREGRAEFDDLSTAYGIASLSFSHAVSDIAEVLRYIWLEAGGIDTRTRLPIRGVHRMTLPRGAP